MIFFYLALLIVNVCGFKYAGVQRLQRSSSSTSTSRLLTFPQSSLTRDPLSLRQDTLPNLNATIFTHLEDFGGKVDVVQVPENNRLKLRVKQLEYAESEKYKWIEKKKAAEDALLNAIADGQKNLQSYFKEYERYLIDEKVQISQANFDIFDAFNEQDVDKLKYLFLDSNDTYCLEAGENYVKHGYQNIIDKWKYEPLSTKKFKVLEVFGFEYMGEAAVVSNIIELNETNKITYELGLPIGTVNPITHTTRAYVTNVFVKTKDPISPYKLFAHHGSAIPIDELKLYSYQNIYKNPEDSEEFSSAIQNAWREYFNDEVYDNDGSEESRRRFLSKLVKSETPPATPLAYDRSGYENDFVDRQENNEYLDTYNSEYDSDQNYGDDEDEENSDDDEIIENNIKENAAKALDALKWLHKNNRLKLEDKNLLTTDVIRNLAAKNFSKTEIAFSLIIGNGKKDSINSIPHDMSLIKEDDMNEFEVVCKNIAANLRRN